MKGWIAHIYTSRNKSRTDCLSLSTTLEGAGLQRRWCRSYSRSRKGMRECSRHTYRRWHEEQSD